MKYALRDNALWRAFFEEGNAADCPVYDVHGHMGTHSSIHMPAATPEAMVAHLERVNGKLVFSHHWTLHDPAAFGNDKVYEIVRRFPDRLRMYVGFSPHFPEIVKRDLDAFDRWRPLAAGFKILADYHGVPVDDPRYAAVLERADAEGLPVLFHTWASSCCNGPAQLRRLIVRYPHIKYLLAHAFNPDWESAIAIAREYPQVFLELTSVTGNAGVLERFVAEVGSERILHGTDLPWFDEYQALGGILGARLSEEDMRNILYRNAKKLFPEF